MALSYPSLPLICLGLPSSLDLRNPKSSRDIIFGEPDIVVVLAQGPAPPKLDAKPELLDTQITSA
ncbi:THAP domain-containing protein 8 [Pteropus alecto]|uniref:THAP domain-containing protein 8 n=1 Tax=Pteropus alecto TaxID=9402 RepID=L5L213_PTEAL|nr:THAP domain-containing protein 8 [Pteropus alecto]